VDPLDQGPFAREKIGTHRITYMVKTKGNRLPVSWTLSPTIVGGATHHDNLDPTPDCEPEGLPDVIHRGRGVISG